MKPKFYEFFAGGGMARAALEPDWKCIFANDIDPLKADIYARNWGSKEFSQRDIAGVTASELTEKVDLAWASFPCQDLSIAGLGAGLLGARSAAFWSYCELLQRLYRRSRLPSVLVLENVSGALASRRGRDFREICRALADLNYRFGAAVIDAAHFVPQSRPRIFIIATRRPKRCLDGLTVNEPADWCTTDLLLRAYESLPNDLKENWRWWRLPKPRKRQLGLGDVVDLNLFHAWHTENETEGLLRLMTAAHMSKIHDAQNKREIIVGTIYRRMRRLKNGSMKQRAEVRFDDIAGCLRTPSGGSSRQIIIAVGRKKIRTRLLAIEEGARLMGLPRSYKLPANYYDAFRVLGDGLAVPLVRYLSSQLLLPLASA